MRIFMISFAMLLFAAPAFGDYIENRTLSLPAADITRLEIDCGAGSFEISGVDNLSSIEVKAEIVIEGFNKEEALKYMERYMRLELDKNGSVARLKSIFEDGGKSFWSFFEENSAQIDLSVKIPKNMMLDIDDGSGDILIADINGNVKLNDGSGAMIIADLGGNLDISDGSGGIKVRHVKRNLEIEDGSGEIDIEDVGGDIDINDGSGDIIIELVSGSVTVDDGSGDIRIDNVRQNVEIINGGSGEEFIINVDGRVYGDIDYDDDDDYYRR
jgi:hypothetical protein